MVRDGRDIDELLNKITDRDCDGIGARVPWERRASNEPGPEKPGAGNEDGVE